MSVLTTSSSLTGDVIKHMTERLYEVVKSTREQVEKLKKEIWAQAETKKTVTQPIKQFVETLVEAQQQNIIANELLANMDALKANTKDLLFYRASPPPDKAANMTAVLYLSLLSTDPQIKIFREKLFQHYLITNPSFMFKKEGLSGVAKLRGFVLPEELVRNFCTGYDKQRLIQNYLTELEQKINPRKRSISSTIKNIEHVRAMDSKRGSIYTTGSVLFRSKLTSSFDDSEPLTMSLTPDDVELSKDELDFDLGAKQQPLFTVLKDRFKVTNKSQANICVSVSDVTSPECNELYKLKINTDLGNVQSFGFNMAVTVSLELEVFCTCCFTIDLQISARISQMDCVPIEKHVKIPVQSQFSELLDPRTVKREKFIGEGGYAKVYRGMYTEGDQEVAIKVFNFEGYSGSEEEKSFQDEVKLMMYLNMCDYIVKFIGAIQTSQVEKQMAIVMEFCPYGSLMSAAQKHKDIFDERMITKALLNVTCALEFLHRRGLVHRDLKADNALVVSLNPNERIICKLSDFDTTRAVNTHSKHTLRYPLDTSQVYIAPEMFKTNGNIGVAGDIYAFGLIIWSLFSGKDPFSEMQSNGPGSLEKAVIEGMRPEIPPEMPDFFKELAQNCWKGDPKERPVVLRVKEILLGHWRDLGGQ